MADKYYRLGDFSINREYQRKLVWTLEEKKSFLDSIVKGYPVPLFIFREVKNDKPREKEVSLFEENNKHYEIVDGLIAMINTDPDERVAIIVGIADSKADAKDFKKHYGEGYSCSDKCYVTGIDSEVEKYWGGNLDKFEAHVKSVVEKEPINKSFKNKVLSGMKFLKFEDKRILAFLCDGKNLNDPVLYNDGCLIRRGSHNHKLDLEELLNLSKSFSNRETVRNSLSQGTNLSQGANSSRTNLF